MHPILRITVVLCAITIATFAMPQPAHAQAPVGLMGDLLKDVADLETKIIDLAKALPEPAYAWRPMEGVRSTGEVFQHIAADNYFMPALMDKPAPKETGITKEYKTAAAWEKKPMDRAMVIAELTKSFEFLKASLTSTTD